MRDSNSFRLGPVLFWALVAAVLVLSVGCVTVTDCRAYVRGKLWTECRWDSSGAR